MREIRFKIAANVPLAKDIFCLDLDGDTSEIKAPGQFVDLKIQGCFLRRPFSVCHWEEGRLRLVYRALGQGTMTLSTMEAGRELEVLTGLGKGFDLSKAGARPLLIGGGLGFTPLYALAEKLIERGVRPQVLLGFASKEQAVFVDEFRALGCPVTVCTEDGSLGIKGYVTQALKDLDYSYFYTCGPEAMFRALARETVSSGQFSFEARMGCGYGACMGCTCQTLTGHKRICKEGPVLEKEEILWQ